MTRSQKEMFTSSCTTMSWAQFSRVASGSRLCTGHKHASSLFLAYEIALYRYIYSRSQMESPKFKGVQSSGLKPLCITQMRYIALAQY